MSILGVLSAFCLFCLFFAAMVWRRPLPRTIRGPAYRRIPRPHELDSEDDRPTRPEPMIGVTRAEKAVLLAPPKRPGQSQGEWYLELAQALHDAGMLNDERSKA